MSKLMEKPTPGKQKTLKNLRNLCSSMNAFQNFYNCDKYIYRNAPNV